MKMKFMFLTVLLLLPLTACREQKEAPAPIVPPVAPVKAALPPPGCRGCHSEMQLDNKHNFACTDCHQGSNETNNKELAHQGLNAQPAAPASMVSVCGRCHREQANGCAQTAHFTLKNEINLIRRQFGLKPVTGIAAIPERSGPPQDKEQLVDDLLRRRCLRCHVQTAGDSYPYVQRGTGCAACHLRKTEGKLTTHAFSLPSEQQCLSCHYGNRVGSDFAGMYEHDYNSDFRAPQASPVPFLRPYGVEQHELVQDIHRQRGMTCLDCHNGAELSGKQAAVTCAACHAPVSGKAPPLKNVRAAGGQLILTAKQDGKEHLIPRLQHPAHAKYGQAVACQVCHAQWSFNDQSTHVLLTYSADTVPWSSLSVQSSSEAEQWINGEEKPTMSDAFTGEKKPGIWLQGYSLRRWENMLIRQDKDGVIKVFRPLLDLRLSAADENGAIIAGLDNITGEGDGLLPYTPHTTGPAGLFYEQRFLHLLKHDKEPASQPK